MEEFLQYLKNCTKNYTPPTDNIDLQGWMDINIMKVFEMTDVKFMIEVGTWKGRSAVHFGNELKETGGTLVCIDTWLGAPEFWTPQGLSDPTRGLSLKPHHGYPTVYYTFLDNVVNSGLKDTIVPFPISSDQGADVLAHYKCKADAIYIDASHEEGPVYKDIQKYWPMVKDGGVLFGDDFSGSWPGVCRDVKKFAAEQAKELVVHGKVWFIKKV